MDSEEKKFSGGRRYTNGEITVYWKPTACVHASYCYRELIEVFDPGRRPWIDLGGSTTEKIIEVINLCPTEALSWKYNDEARNEEVYEDQLNHVRYRRPELLKEKAPEEEERPVRTSIMTDGPIVIDGTFTINYSGKTREITESMVSICRCGASDHQPFCDGQHRKIGFIG
jgi:uncharacterized Fe-S cluster protein YjdI